MKINKLIEKEINESAPSLADKIAEQVDWEQIAADNAPVKTEKKTASAKKKFAWSACAALIAAAICLAVMLPVYFFGGDGSPTGAQTSYSVTIEVNPRIRFEVNAADCVTNQYGLNEDGVILLCKENYVGQNISDATRAVMTKLDSYGFLDSNTVRMCVYDSNGKEYKDKQNAVSEVLESCLASLSHSKPELIDEDEFKRIEKEFKDKNLGEYEKSLIKQYKTAVVELARQKQNDTASLIAAVSPYADKNGKTHIADLPCRAEIEEYAQKYGYETDFDFDKVRGKDLYELIEDLQDDAEDLEEALDEIDKGKNEDDYKDLLKDLYKLVEEYLFERD